MVAFLLRLLVSFLFIGDLTDPHRGHWQFAYETGRVARSLALGHGFADPLWTQTGPTSWLAPVYPLLLGTIFRLFGIYSTASAIVALGLNALFSALTTIPLYFLSRKIFGEQTARYTTWVWAFFPYSVYLSASWVWDTCLATLLLTTLVWLTVELRERKATLLWILYGSLWGVVGLTNPVALSVLPFLGGWLFWQYLRSSLRRAARSLSLSAAMCVLVILPWIGRDFYVFHQLIPIKSVSWLEFAAGNLGSHRHWWNDDEHPSRNMAEYAKYKSLGELGYMESKKTRVVQFVKDNPGAYAWLSVRRFIYVWTGFWSTRVEYLVDEPLDPVSVVVNSSISLTAVWGMWLAWRRRYANLFPSLVTIVIVPAIYYFTHPLPSYRHPVDPQVVLFGAFAAWPVLASEWERSTVRSLVVKFEKFVRVLRGIPALVDTPFQERKLTGALVPMEEDEPRL